MDNWKYIVFHDKCIDVLQGLLKTFDRPQSFFRMLSRSTCCPALILYCIEFVTMSKVFLLILFTKIPNLLYSYK